MEQSQIMALIIALAVFLFIVALHPFESLVKSRRASVWISTLAMCGFFWSIVAAVIVGLSS